MGTTTTTTTTYTCDVCREPVSGRVVEIGEYGLSFHPACFASTTGPQMVRLMGCDETIVRRLDASGSTVQPSRRVRDPRVIGADGSVSGLVEEVEW